MPVQDLREHLARLAAAGESPMPADLVEEALRHGRGRRRRRATGLAAGWALTITVGALVAVFALTGGVRQGDVGPGARPPAPPAGQGPGGLDDRAQVLPAPVDGTAAVVTQKPLLPVTDTSGIPGVLAWRTDTRSVASVPDPGIEHTHVTGRVVYASTPPVGGPHNPDWMNAGTYTRPVPSERAVHLLEHGVVWVSYRPDLPADQIRALQALVDATGDAAVQGVDLHADYLLLAPWADDQLPTPIVLSAWGRQLQVTDAADPRIPRFITTFRVDHDLTYEAGSASGGEPPEIGGVPARGGTAEPRGQITSGASGQQLLDVSDVTGTVQGLDGPVTGKVALLAGPNINLAGTYVIGSGLQMPDGGIVEPTFVVNGPREQPSDQAKPGLHSVVDFGDGVYGLFTGTASSITVDGEAATVKQIAPGIQAFYLPSATPLVGSVTAVDTAGATFHAKVLH